LKQICAERRFRKGFARNEDGHKDTKRNKWPFFVPWWLGGKVCAERRFRRGKTASHAWDESAEGVVDKRAPHG
jgi:hypothetical protein